MSPKQGDWVTVVIVQGITFYSYGYVHTWMIGDRGYYKINYYGCSLEICYLRVMISDLKVVMIFYIELICWSLTY